MFYHICHEDTDQNQSQDQSEHENHCVKQRMHNHEQLHDLNKAEHVSKQTQDTNILDAPITNT